MNGWAQSRLTEAAGASGGSQPSTWVYVGGALLLAFVSSIGFLARIRERKTEQGKLEQREHDRGDAAQL